MTLVCLVQPATAPMSKVGIPLFDAFSLLKNPNFAVFIITSMAVAGMMQFYFLSTGQFLTDMGGSGKNVSAIMGIAQAAQALATLLLLDLFYSKLLGPKWTITVGAACWLLLYVVYSARLPKALIVLAQVFHGLAYVFFMIGGQMYANQMAPAGAGGSAQALILWATNAVGLFLGTQLAGLVLDRFSAGGKFNWSKIFLVPLLVTLAGALALALVF
jgi:predicted MFS family arabinose efflux permease